MEKSGNNSLILIIANHGHTDEIMNTARAAGARGGTILRTRWAGPEDTEQFYGIKIQAEKKTEAGAMICSLGIDQIIRLG